MADNDTHTLTEGREMSKFPKRIRRDGGDNGTAHFPPVLTTKLATVFAVAERPKEEAE